MNIEIPVTIPKFQVGDRVRVYVNWIGYQKGTIIAKNNISPVYGWLYDVKIDEGQETNKKYLYDKCDLDIRKIKENKSL